MKSDENSKSIPSYKTVLSLIFHKICTMPDQDIENTTSSQPMAQGPQEQIEAHEEKSQKKFGTLSGVFTPTLLTIIGAIMFLREGWVVGNAGLLGSTLIILLACGITTATGLSMSCITTNIRVGAGGAFSMISQSLGLEVGGSIGIPLCLSQTLAVAMYIFGFREGWLWIFPHHPALIVDLSVFAMILVIAFISTDLAFRIQYLIMAVIAGALVSVAIAAFTGSMQQPIQWWGTFPGSPENRFTGASFWTVFAVFFPAATGIMAGANMSGELKNPRRSIPIGTLSAILLSVLIYLALAYWLARSVPPEELVKNYTILVDRAFWGPAVLAGLLGATFSSALSSFVGAPRILGALGSYGILPGGHWLAKRSAKGEPRNATYLIAGIVLASLMMRDLNVIAPLITLFFLITYAMINLVVLVEQNLKLLSFRPFFRIPRVVPVLGLFGCLFAMFIINPTLSLTAGIVVVAVYSILLQRHLTAPFGDVRSGLFFAVAEWAARRVTLIQTRSDRVWKPNLLVPTQNSQKVRGWYRLLLDIAYPTGSVKLLGIAPSDQADELEQLLIDSRYAFREDGVFASSSVLELEDFTLGITAGIQALGGSFFRPNLLFLEWLHSELDGQELHHVIKQGLEHHLGIALLVEHPKAGLGRRKRINLWIPDQSPDWDIQMKFANLDLAILLAYRIQVNWHASLNLITLFEQPEMRSQAEDFTKRLVDLARLSATTEHHCMVGTLTENLATAPQADLNILVLDFPLEKQKLERTCELTRATCLFTYDGGEESALA